MSRRLPLLVLPLVVVGVLASPSPGKALPERVFAEPRDSVDFITHGPTYEPEAFKNGMLALEDAFPRWIDFTTVREELGEPLAVSTGEDGLPAWDPADTHDGQDFQVVSVTDRSVPEADKQYVL